MSDIKQLEQQFTNGYAHEASFIDHKAQVEFSTVQVGEIPAMPAISIMDMPVQTDASASMPVEVALATSEFFKRINPAGRLASAVRIKVTDEAPVDFKEAGQAWVSTGAIQIADPKFQEVMSEIFASHEFENDPWTEMASGAHADIAFEKGIETEVSKVSTVNGAFSLDISSGYGDGSYPIWVGTDAAGKVAVIYVDFQLFDRADVIEGLLSQA